MSIIEDLPLQLVFATVQKLVVRNIDLMIRQEWLARNEFGYTASSVFCAKKTCPPIEPFDFHCGIHNTFIDYTLCTCTGVRRRLGLCQG